MQLYYSPPLSLLLSPPLLIVYRTVSAESDTSAQIVPDMEDKHHSSDITMTTKTEGLPPGSAHLTSTATMTAMQLTLNPIRPDSHVSNPVHPTAAAISFQGSPVHIATSPVHAAPFSFQGSPVHVATSPVHMAPISFHTSTLAASGGQQLILNSDLSSAYLLTPLTASLSGTGTIPFIATPSPPSNSVFNISPTHSIGPSSSPISIPTSPTHSYSLPFSRVACHRPVGPSHSVDSYFTPHTLSGHPLPSSTSPSTSASSHVRPTALMSPQHSRNLLLPSVSESGRSSENISVSSSALVVSNPVESIVTVRTAPRTNGERNRHSYTSGDVAVSNLSQVGTSPRAHPPPYRRRNSSGDLNSTRARRSSHGSLASPSASQEATSLASHTHAHTHHGCTRRRSHDHMDRNRSSRSASREPYTLNPQ